MTMTNLSQLAITDPHNWTPAELYTNLQAAVDVELWTIPLYLTALYSIQGLDSSKQTVYPLAAKLIESVVIEEMLHLQEACNLCNALGYTPQFNLPSYDEAEGIPFLQANVPSYYQGYTVELGALNLNQMKLFCVIELPEPTTPPDWSTQTKYNSIGELYQALEISITNLFPSLYKPENAPLQQANFTDYLNKYKTNPTDGFSQIVSDLPSALAAMQAIVGQGEGNNTGEIPDPDQPPPSSTDPSGFDPAESHFIKFNTVFSMLNAGTDVPAVYPVNTTPDKQQLADQATAQIALQNGFKSFLQILESGFTTPQQGNQMPNNFWPAMFNMQTLITNVWAAGAVPVFPSE